MTLLQIAQKELFRFLSEQAGPVMEVELIRRFASCQDEKDNNRLFIQHFSLYHALYRMKQCAGSAGYHLHLDPMRIRMVRIPGEGRCGHYLPEEGIFCPMESGTCPYCEYHRYMHGEDDRTIFYDPLLEFYLNPDNIYFGNDRILRRLMQGIKVYAIRKGEIEEALKFFGISNPGKSVIQKRYHEMAKKYHPDSRDGSEQMMRRINDAYHILREVFIL